MLKCAWVHEDLKGCDKEATHWNKIFGELCKDHAHRLASRSPTGQTTKYKVEKLYPTRFGNSIGVHGTVKE